MGPIRTRELSSTIAEKPAVIILDTFDTYVEFRKSRNQCNNVMGLFQVPNEERYVDGKTLVGRMCIVKDKKNTVKTLIHETAHAVARIVAMDDGLSMSPEQQEEFAYNLDHLLPAVLKSYGYTITKIGKES